MNDRLMIAAMLAQSLAPNWNGGWDNELVAECLSFADALLAAAGDDPATHEDCVSVAVHNAVMDRLQVDFDAFKAKGRELEGMISIGMAENERLRGRIDEERQRAMAAESVTAALKRRLEPIQSDEAVIVATKCPQLPLSGHVVSAIVTAADLIREMRGK